MKEMRGAYGLTLTGVRGAEAALVAADPQWPALEISVELGSGELDREHIGGRTAAIRLRTGGSVRLDREAGRARFSVPEELSPDELVHPFLAPVAVVASYWHGRESLHGGAFVVNGRAWGVLGERHDGKSSLLAGLSVRDVDVVCDDVLVIDGDTAFAGPRTIDLRADAARTLGIGEYLGVVGARERWRLRLGPLQPSLAMGGWVFATWAETAALQRLPASETLARLLQHRGIRIPPSDPAALLALAALPAWELRRPRRWDVVDETVERLLDGLVA